MQKDLDDYAQFKKKLGVYAMELSFLSELYCTNAEQNIAKKITILKAIAFNEKIEKKLAETNSKLADVKRCYFAYWNMNERLNLSWIFYHFRFVDSTRNVVKHSNIDRSISEANREINALVEKKVSVIQELINVTKIFGI